MNRTYVAFLPDDNGGRGRLRLDSGSAGLRALLRPRLLGLTAGSASVALVADRALLLSEEHVRIEVVVGAGMRLQIVEPSGTVAYHMRGGAASWDVDVTVGRGATLVWHGQPFVVAATTPQTQMSRWVPRRFPTGQRRRLPGVVQRGER